MNRQNVYEDYSTDGIRDKFGDNSDLILELFDQLRRKNSSNFKNMNELTTLQGLEVNKDTDIKEAIIKVASLLLFSSIESSAICAFSKVANNLTGEHIIEADFCRTQFGDDEDEDSDEGVSLQFGITNTKTRRIVKTFDMGVLWKDLIQVAKQSNINNLLNNCRDKVTIHLFIEETDESGEIYSSDDSQAIGFIKAYSGLMQEFNKL